MYSNENFVENKTRHYRCEWHVSRMSSNVNESIRTIVTNVIFFFYFFIENITHLTVFPLYENYVTNESWRFGKQRVR